MQDVVYERNVFAERACPVCGTDRGRRPRRARGCAACGAPLAAGEAFVRRVAGGARLACSIACLKALHEEDADASAGCGWCDARRPPVEGPERSCLQCAARLSGDVGYVGIVRGGRARTFCDVACLAAYLSSPNPLCG
ncbi:MAG TPA: hypothetical protein VJ326_10180 [Thermoplasmata archaeon]|nr:hypothetical protein [Thermoplasmata archaeon]